MQASDLLISANQLAARIGELDLFVIDCRWSLTEPDLGKRQWFSSHIPTSHYMPLEFDMSEHAGKAGRHPLPTKAKFAQTLGKYGISHDSLVVPYDDGSSIYAGRLWWMLRWVGHSKVRVLDGGLHQWEACGFETTDSSPKDMVATDYELRPSLTRDCGADELINSQHTMIDARSQDRFHGENETLDHTAGHIPGAVCFPFNENLNEDMTFKRDSTRFETLSKDKPTVAYCGSGVSATNNILALLLAGHPEPILYPGSWSEWIEDSERPIAT